jgi:FtsP/CotA-like multicopper oxidase with cupredoxin domain
VINRRHLLQLSSKLAALVGVGAVAPHVLAQASSAHQQHVPSKRMAPTAARPASAMPTAQGYRPVKTLNGRTLPYRLRDGVKEFHLIAQEIDHEFAPGTTVKAWGYNGSTPGPTLEAVEGDRVRIYVTNRLKEHTSVHWHGLILPSGMDGVGGLSQPHIQPGETFVYEFTLQQHGTHMYHPHADEMVQLAMGMMGLFIIHPKDPASAPVDRDYAILLHNWAVHPGTWRPDPSVMVDFDLWTMNSKVFPAIEALLAQTGERVRIRFANLSMWNHPMHLHGVQFHVTGSDGGRWPPSQWRSEVTEIVGVGQTRDIEFTAVPGDWALHCHMSHHTMNAMGHGIPSAIGVDQSGVEDKMRALLPGYMAMGKNGMAEHGEHVAMGHMPGPDNTLPMMAGTGPYGNLDMGGMFTVVKVRDQLTGDRDPGWYDAPPKTTAWRVKSAPRDLPV